MDSDSRLAQPVLSHTAEQCLKAGSRSPTLAFTILKRHSNAMVVCNSLMLFSALLCSFRQHMTSWTRGEDGRCIAQALCCTSPNGSTSLTTGHLTFARERRQGQACSPSEEDSIGNSHPTVDIFHQQPASLVAKSSVPVLALTLITALITALISPS